MKYNDDGGKNDKSMMVMTMEIYSGACCCSSGAAQQPTDPAPAPTGGEDWVYTGQHRWEGGFSTYSVHWEAGEGVHWGFVRFAH